MLRDARIQARVAEIKAEIGAALQAGTIRDVKARVDALDDRWMRMRQVIDARSKDEDHQKAPGGDTGLLVRTLKILGSGVVAEFAVDAALLREMREHEQQAAKELGQWAEKHEHSGPEGGPIAVTDERLAALTDDELAEFAVLIRKLADAGGGGSGTPAPGAP